VLVKTNQRYISALAGRDGGGRERAAPDCRSGGGGVLLSMRIGAALDSGSPCALVRFLLQLALVARGGGGRHGGRLKAPLSIHAGAASPLLEDGVKP
jgi:hypothetical protein